MRVSAWGRLMGHAVSDRRRLRTLSRGARQLAGLRAILAPASLDLIVLDEPWEGLDPDGARWLTALLTSKRDRGSAVIVSSHRLHDLAGLCDGYLFVVNQRSTFIRAFELSPVGPVSGPLLADTFDRLRAGEPWVRGAP
jgi:ABC-type multidrug transport system ATPase subunit